MKNRKPVYKDSSRSVSERVKDLMGRMTLEEKIYQMSCVVGEELLNNMEDYSKRNMLDYFQGIQKLIGSGEFSSKKAKELIGKGIGTITLQRMFFGPQKDAGLSNQVQSFLVKHTRLGIPAILHVECLHGCVTAGGSSFPQSIGMGSTWDPALMKKVASAIGKEAKSRGLNQALSPTINITRDSRCGRTEETYGEDPLLTSEMGVAFVEGIQSQKIAATPKHYAANFVGDGGRDSNIISFSERILREIYFPAFKKVFQKAGALSVMAAYNSLDGTPCSSNKWLLTDILRKEWGFKGFAVSDYGSVYGIHGLHKTAETKADTAMQAVEAGLDMELPNSYFYNELIGSVKKREFPEEFIDRAVERILRVKFWMGLFDNPYCDPKKASKTLDCKEHRALALDAARKAIVLLKNDNVLPLSKNIKSIVVIGPASDCSGEQLGGYSNRGAGIKVVTPLGGIKNKAAKNTKVYFARGCDIKDPSREGFEDALEMVRKSDVAVLFMGNSSLTEGEHKDRCDLDLPGVQEELILEIVNTGTPVIVVLINGSAVTMTKWIDKVNAVVEAWYPGEEGGNAIADVLFGNYNPGGKLPLTFPKFTGQLPLYYNYKPTGRTYDYVDLRGEQALFPFGYGLSYTEFKYSNLRITPGKILPAGRVKISADIQNAGDCRGDEVVQLYVHDAVACVARPVKELKGFRRITLKPKEKKTVRFEISAQELALYDQNMKLIVEPGTFEVMIGSSSQDIRLNGTFEVMKK